ncbi:hypothetical protein NPI44_004359 [Citrobacter freundii]|uniref:hypothetical protein n=1 Tax=Citrobacter freundii TaxID=546 RepID=UPI00155ED263|nr:hypothetical protein [Citrobacter freundii]EJD6640751.1 hypothetical protein [Citrobacter freundii]EKT9196852.1 hypothetical protein [Citrobacter freundii]EKU2334915.1 hypothetical protein [Citrobacter freundii]
MKERGMIFNAEMVRALLDGRKTQTRRPIKWKQTRFTEIGEREDGSKWPWSEDVEHACDFWHPCPFGAVGDRIWVRETFCAVPDHEEPAGCSALLYAADGNGPYGKWTPSIHMPRWASRILLEITSVRVERLHDMNETDSLAEGIQFSPYPLVSLNEFALLWESIYNVDPSKSWKANPWVWVIEFKHVLEGAQ